MYDWIQEEGKFVCWMQRDRKSMYVVSSDVMVVLDILKLITTQNFYYKHIIVLDFQVVPTALIISFHSALL